ncbi:MAG: hypothetical protein MI717_03395 [Spirochaetales bacterium]|nr:hypothetical protein [Spirochaetales bacterium]
MAKSVKIIFVLLFVVILVYLLTWNEIKSKSELYYNYSVEFYENNEFEKAIKGHEQVIRNQYVYFSGLQQICTAWESPLSWPKPKVYSQAKEKLNDIIVDKMSIEERNSFIKKYFQIDKKYLAEMMLSIGDSYYERGELEKALQTYEKVKEIFVHRKDAQNKADIAIAKIGKDK